MIINLYFSHNQFLYIQIIEQQTFLSQLVESEVQAMVLALLVSYQYHVLVKGFVIEKLQNFIQLT